MDTQLLRDTLDDLDRNLLERDLAVRVLLLAALAGEHVLLVGPPGTAKSELARRLHAAFIGTTYFERLLTRFSVPEELFGPLSLKALELDRYERLIDGFLPTAQVAFLDEVFKANSAILNALLTLLNEREFDNGAGRIQVPLITVVGATNEVPDDESLTAFYDRFLLRLPVAPVGDASFPALLALPAASPPVSGRIPTELLQPLRARAADVPLSGQVTALLLQVRAWCVANQLTVSDRRWRKLVALLKVEAALRQAPAVDAWDLWLLPYALAARADQVPALTDWFMHTVAQARRLDLQWLERAAKAFEKQLEIESSAQAIDDDDGAGKLALARAISRQASASEDSLLRIVSERARRRYGALHIEARVCQVVEVRARAQTALDAARVCADISLAAADAHLWLPPSWRARIAAVHGANVQSASALVDALALTQQGFEALPLDAELAAPAPQPMVVAV